MARPKPTDNAHVRSRFHLALSLALAAATVCLVPGDAVAHPGGTGSAANVNGAQHGAQVSSDTQTRLLVSDMSRPSEALPAGVPRWWDWVGQPRTRPFGPLRRLRAFTAWGQLYQCAGMSPTPHATVELRDLQAWVLPRHSRRWQRVQVSSDLGGAAFAEDYAGRTVPGRYTASSNDTTAQLVRGHNFHFWPDAGRVPLNGANVRAITVAIEARFEAATTKGCLVLSVGGDMWSSLTAQAGGDSSGDVGIGRFKRVERRWRLYTMTTATAGLLNRIPVPPLAPAGTEF